MQNFFLGLGNQVIPIHYNPVSISQHAKITGLSRSGRHLSQLDIGDFFHH